MQLKLKLLTLVAGFWMSSLAWAAAPAGGVILVQGAAFVRDAAGIERAATMGATIQSGETLLTRDGRMQVRFSDGGFISLQPETQFKITDYHFKDSAQGDDSAIFKLIKGGFRTITGLVGKRKPSAYQVNTVTATIGVRGTEYQAILCASSCKEPDGLYVHTGEGTIFVKNAAGEIDVGAGQSAYVASPNTAPQKTTTAPAMTARSTVTGPTTVPGVSVTEFQPGNIEASNSLGPVTPITGGGLAMAAAGTLSGTASTNVVGLFNNLSGQVSGEGSGAGSIGTLDPGVIGGVYMNGNAVTGAVVTSNGGIASVIFSSPPLNVGSNGDLYWGRWSGTMINLYAGLGGEFAKATLSIPDTSSIHYLLGTTTPTISSSLSTATYTFVGGTPSTDQAGGVGSGITGGSLIADFGANNVTGGFTVNHGGSNYIVSSLYMPIGINHPASFGTDKGGSGSATGSGATGAVQVNGFFVGTGAPTGAGISYSIQRSGAGGAIVGVGAFR